MTSAPPPPLRIDLLSIATHRHYLLLQNTRKVRLIFSTLTLRNEHYLPSSFGRVPNTPYLVSLILNSESIMDNRRMTQDGDDGQQHEQQQEIPLPMCSICHHDPPVNGVQLGCGHVFCYLCIKSACETTGVCALCRQEIGYEFNFQEHSILGTVKLPAASPDGFYWFYEGYRGWWLYDSDTNRDIEDAYQRGETTFEKFIAGSVYLIDLNNMIQQRKDEPEGRQRKVCRATLDMENILGMAGLKGKDFSEALEMMRFVSPKNDDYPAPPM